MQSLRDKTNFGSAKGSKYSLNVEEQCIHFEMQHLMIEGTTSNFPMHAEEAVVIFPARFFMLCFTYINSSPSRESTFLCLLINFPIANYYSVVKIPAI